MDINKKLLRLTSVFVFLLFFLMLFPAKTYAASTWYVSKLGNNSAGTSWTTAWNELEQINWSLVQPGDIIELDGGPTRCLPPNPNIAVGQDHVEDRTDIRNNTCGIRYNSTLTIGKSGTGVNPITVRVSIDTGRNGTAVIFGGRSTLLPECGSGASPSLNYGVRLYGIAINGQSYIRIEGQKWSGMVIYGHANYGIALGGANNLIRNVEIFDNGSIMANGDPDQKGVSLAGSNNRFERVLIHDNGQDAMQGASITNLSLYESWLYNSREHTTEPNRVFNSCRHSDGIQLFGGDVVYSSGVKVERSVIGPGFMQNLLLGEAPGSDNREGTVDNVTLKDTMFIKATTTSISTHDPVAINPKNWVIDNVTSVRRYDSSSTSCTADTGHTVLKEQWHNIYATSISRGFSVTDSIFYGGCHMPTSSAIFANASNNCQADIKTGYLPATSGSQGIVGDPMFTRVSWATRHAPHLNDDYTLLPGSPCAGKGSSITSASQLLSLGGTPVSTATPTPNVPSPTSAPGTSVILQAEQGIITAPFTVNGTYITQSSQTTDPSLGGRAAYIFNLSQAGTYQVRMNLNASTLSSNSLFVNIDSEPTTPTMIWDIYPATSGFENRTISWRGNGTDAVNEIVPKLFNLTAGSHTLVVRGREANVQIDSIQISLANCSLGDLNCDSHINTSDLFQFLTLSQFSSTADLNQDGKNNMLDVVYILKNWIP